MFKHCIATVSLWRGMKLSYFMKYESMKARKSVSGKQEIERKEQTYSLIMLWKMHLEFSKGKGMLSLTCFCILLICSYICNLIYIFCNRWKYRDPICVWFLILEHKNEKQRNLNQSSTSTGSSLVLSPLLLWSIWLDLVLAHVFIQKIVLVVFF